MTIHNVLPRNVARVYAKMAADLRTRIRTAPTFDDGVTLHRIIAAVETGKAYPAFNSRRPTQA